MTKVQQRVLKVLGRIADQVQADIDVASVFADELEVMLADLHQQDFFGTEGQNDPRGDFRDGDWFLPVNVQGIDG